jgi:hypothetical protein
VRCWIAGGMRFELLFEEFIVDVLFVRELVVLVIVAAKFESG